MEWAISADGQAPPRHVADHTHSRAEVAGMTCLLDTSSASCLANQEQHAHVAVRSPRAEMLHTSADLLLQAHGFVSFSECSTILMLVGFPAEYLICAPRGFNAACENCQGKAARSVVIHRAKRTIRSGHRIVSGQWSHEAAAPMPSVVDLIFGERYLDKIYAKQSSVSPECPVRPGTFSERREAPATQIKRRRPRVFRPCGWSGRSVCRRRAWSHRSEP